MFASFVQDGIPSKAVGVQGSPFLKWVNLFSSGQGSQRQFLLQVGVDSTYYQNQIPPCLKNGTAVQLYPLLFQVGVDIRQWGAHAGSNLMKNGKQETNGALVDDEDDDIGVVDDDVLVALNFEALRKVRNCAWCKFEKDDFSDLLFLPDECICARDKPPGYPFRQSTGGHGPSFCVKTWKLYK